MLKKLTGPAIVAAALVSLAPADAVRANTTPFSLSSGPFMQDWSNTSLITTNNDWSMVPSIVGYRGDNLTAVTGADPQTIVAPGETTPVSVTANQTAANTNALSGGLYEFELTNPVVAFQGSGTADAPHLVFYLNTAGVQNVNVAYLLRDIDDTADNATQQVALQYRIGHAGDFTNVPEAYVADATTGPSLATLETAVSAMLPAAVNDAGDIELRVITSNAVSNDELVGVDNINITSSPVPEPSALGLLAIGGLAALRRRRRRTV